MTRPFIEYKIISQESKKGSLFWCYVSLARGRGSQRFPYQSAQSKSHLPVIEHRNMVCARTKLAFHLFASERRARERRPPKLQNGKHCVQTKLFRSSHNVLSTLYIDVHVPNGFFISLNILQPV